MKGLFKLVLAGVVAGTAIATVASEASAYTFVNFEDAPAFGLGDDQAVNNQYLDAGFSFGMDNDLDGVADAGISPVIEQSGKAGKDGFVNGTKQDNDVAADGYFDAEKGITYADRLGNYFLRTGGLGGNGGNLLITYTNGTAAASGELWDIDGNQKNEWGGNYVRTEQWEVQALGVNGEVLEALTSPLGDEAKGDLDGLPWFWSFQRETNDIKAIRFMFTGESPAKNVGLAFDNFSAFSVEGEEPESVPEPAMMLGLLTVGAFGFVARKRG
ncbi:MAG: PEP-CTERM sorting domain-containing protein [Spirulinaceae cyanobacterium RM2_2_10]|nr:PEP-CTERM sorting domain-containing protein [Spirulinaceae cyanobacterium SM2_1_0]NJO19810.1 PEP-CTERM sorting domain-containing protein [Spirulinaceae cyanobacterium RM2_2_10]